jgi:hypothetical protein
MFTYNSTNTNSVVCDLVYSNQILRLIYVINVVQWQS